MIPDALRRRRYSLLWLIGIAGLGVALAVLATLPLVRGEPDARGGPLVGLPAPELVADGLDGRRWTIGDGEGRLVWVNFWATSCEPCRTEMPAMQRLAEEYPDRLLILGVNWGEGRDAVVDFADRYGVTYPILMDPALENYYRWAGTDGLPRHYFIGSEGTVLREVIGPLEPTRMVELLEELMGSA